MGEGGGGDHGADVDVVFCGGVLLVGGGGG